MWGKFSRSWYLIKLSFGILREDPELLIYPVISLIAAVILMGIFAIPLFWNYTLTSAKSVIYPVFILYYLILYSVIIFSNSALVGSIIIKIRGGNPTISDGFGVAFSHIWDIFGYALIAATVGLILSMIQEKLGSIGKIFTFITSLAWSVMTFLVVPVLIVEGIGSVDAIKRSSLLLKKTWGEQIIGNAGIGYFFAFVILGLSLLILPVISYTYSHQMIMLTVASGVILGLIFFLGIIVSATLDTIYRVILYRYAVDGVAHSSYDEDILRDSFRNK
ncbi:MAG TPA: DUF6159 family protein [Balneolales bacterium]|nr:DUF6159 family protein [Balneolales bacterium]